MGEEACGGGQLCSSWPPGFAMACCIQCVSTGNIGIVERFGKFSHTANPGMNCILWPVFSMSQTLSMRIQPLVVECETKTRDNVFVNVAVSVQYQVIREKVKEAAYKLTNPQQQIRAYVFDVVRSTVPQMDLDRAFESKDTVAQSVKEQLTHAMSEYGYVILQALVTDLNPDNRVRSAMNEINASKRLKEAATEKAEAEKILLVKAAEADAESKYLSGVGVAKQRKAIVDGLRDSVSEFSESVDGARAKDVISLLVITQYFDMLDNVGTQSKSSTLFLPHSPNNVVSLQHQLKEGLSTDMKR